MPILIMLVSLLLIPSLSLAGDYYVAQYATGSDSGSDCTNAHSVVWFNSVYNWGTGTGRIAPGSSVHLCGVITTSLVIQGSGAAGAPVTIRFENGAKLSQPVCPYPNGCLNTNGNGYLVVDGGTNGVIESTANGTNLPNRLSSVGLSAIKCSNCEVKNLTIQNTYVHTSNLSDSVVSYDQVNAIRYSGSNIAIHDNILHDAGWAIYQSFGNDSSISIYNNRIYNSSHGITIGGYGGYGAVKASNIRIYSNHIYDYANWDTAANTYHHDGIHVYGVLGAVLTDMDIYNNQFDGDCGDHMTGHIYVEGKGDTTWQRVRTFNNVAICGSTRTVNGIVWINAGTDYEIYNNTIIGSPGSVCLNSSNLARPKIKNNAFSTCNMLIQFGTYGPVTFANAATDMNYNTYGDQGNNAWHWIGVCSFCGNFSTWITNCGCDGKSVNAVSLSLDGFGFPLNGSPVTGIGVNLTNLSLSNLNKDKRLVPRSSSIGWSAGAYEIVTNVTLPNPPQNLKVY